MDLFVLGGKLQNQEEQQTFWQHVMNDNVKQYLLIIDKVVCDSATNALEGLQMLIASYFVFNRTYPKEGSCFLQFVQMRFLEIFSTEASKCKSKALTNKVQTLINKLNSLVVDEFADNTN